MISVEFTTHMAPHTKGTRYPMEDSIARKLLKDGDAKDPYVWKGPISDEIWQEKMRMKAEKDSAQKSIDDEKNRRKSLKKAALALISNSGEKLI